MRFILPILLTVLTAAFAAPAHAASYRVGIGEQSAELFGDARFQQTKIKRVRYLVSWDWNRRSWERGEVTGFLNGVQSSRREAFVTFTAPRGCWSNNRYSRA